VKSAAGIAEPRNARPDQVMPHFVEEVRSNAWEFGGDIGENSKAVFRIFVATDHSSEMSIGR
jgi:hypothetical protein